MFEKVVKPIAECSFDMNMVIFITSQLFIISKSKNALMATGVLTLAAIVIFIFKVIYFATLKKTNPSINLVKKIASSIFFPVAMCAIWYLLSLL